MQLLRHDKLAPGSGTPPPHARQTVHYLGEGETCELDTKGRVLLVAHSFSVLLYSACYRFQYGLQPTYTIPPIGNLAIYVTRRNRGLLVLIPSIVSNQQNDHLVIVQRKSKHGLTN